MVLRFEVLTNSWYVTLQHISNPITMVLLMPWIGNTRFDMHHDVCIVRQGTPPIIFFLPAIATALPLQCRRCSMFVHGQEITTVTGPRAFIKRLMLIYPDESPSTLIASLRRIASWSDKDRTNIFWFQQQPNFPDVDPIHKHRQWDYYVCHFRLSAPAIRAIFSPFYLDVVCVWIWANSP